MTYGPALYESMRLIELHHKEFDPLFPRWLASNFDIFQKFEDLALAVAGKRARYGAASVWEVIRYNTVLGEADSEFKVNNNYRADCARLFMLLHPEHPQFFAVRERTRPLGVGGRWAWGAA